MSGYSEALRRADFRAKGADVDPRTAYPERIVVQLTTGRVYVFDGDTDPAMLFGGREVVGCVGTLTHGGRYVAERNAEVAVLLNPEEVATVEIER